MSGLNRRLGEIAFALVVLVIDLLALRDAMPWTIKAGLFPRAIGIPLAILLILLLIRLAKEYADERKVETRPPLPLTLEERREQELERRRIYAIVAWLLIFLVGIWVIGFPLAGVLGTLAFLRLYAHEKWPISFWIAGGTAVFFYVMVTYLNTPFPRGWLFETFIPG